MHTRCSNPRHPYFHLYGGAGITVCESWSDFRNFLADMGVRPEEKTLDRHPNNRGNYEPGNCRWATKLEQAHNKSDARLVSFDGREQCAAAWAREMGLDASTVRFRLRSGWSVERALTTPADTRCYSRSAA
jgi:hypothetical protein